MNSTQFSFGCCQLRQDLFDSYYVSRLDSAPAIILCSAAKKVFVHFLTEASKIELPELTMRQCHTPRVYPFPTKRILNVAWSPQHFSWGDSFHEDHFSLEWKDLAADTYINAPEKLTLLPPGKYLYITAKSNQEKRIDDLFQEAFREMNVRLAIFLEKQQVHEVTCFNVTREEVERFDLPNHRMIESSQREIYQALTKK